jgi:hypothetical protein
MAEDIWYYAEDGNQVGPVTAETLRRLLAAGQWGPTDPVWQNGMTEWVAAESVPAHTPLKRGVLRADPPVQV